MNNGAHVPPPPDAAKRRAAKPTVVYPPDTLPPFDAAFYENARTGMSRISDLVVPPRDAKTFHVPKGHIFRITSVDGPQVGDLNLWNAADLSERFFSGKTRALHATHVSTGDRLWSNLPYLRPMATITHDTLAWYGWDEDGAGIHDVIGTRCDPYTNRLLHGVEYHHCCHSNLTRALAEALNTTLAEAEPHVHDVLNVFMCTGFTRDTHQYFMKASPVRPGDYIEVLCRDRPARRAVDLSGRRLRLGAFGRCRALLSAESRDLRAAGRSRRRLAIARAQRLFPRPRPGRRQELIAPPPRLHIRGGGRSRSPWQKAQRIPCQAIRAVPAAACKAAAATVGTPSRRSRIDVQARFMAPPPTVRTLRKGVAPNSFSRA